MIDNILRFSVTPYALFDVLQALENTKDHNRYLEFGVTKQDNEITVWVVEHFNIKSVANSVCEKWE